MRKSHTTNTHTHIHIHTHTHTHTHTHKQTALYNLTLVHYNTLTFRFFLSPLSVGLPYIRVFMFFFFFLLSFFLLVWEDCTPHTVPPQVASRGDVLLSPHTANEENF